MARVNGRSCPLADNFTCVSHKGTSVMDYFVVAHETFEQVKNFDVKSITDVVHDLQLMDIAEGRLSEHAILLMSIFVGQCET